MIRAKIQLRSMEDNALDIALDVMKCSSPLKLHVYYRRRAPRLMDCSIRQKIVTTKHHGMSYLRDASDATNKSPKVVSHVPLLSERPVLVHPSALQDNVSRKGSAVHILPRPVVHPLAATSIPIISPVAPRESQGHVLEEVDELRRSHAAMAVQLSVLVDDISSLRKSAESERATAILRTTGVKSIAIRRTIIFAKISAVKALQSGSIELGKKERPPCAANSIRQVFIKSRPSDCTLLDFQLLAQELLKSPTIHCSVFPSEYYATFPTVCSVSRLEIIFPCYSSMCEALQISVGLREAGLYKERYSSAREGRQLRASQILGVSLLRKLADGSNYRTVLIGHGMPLQEPDYQIPSLFQSSCVWQDDTWTTGFSFRKESSKSLARLPAPLDLSDILLRPRISDINRRGPEQRTFSLVWERSTCISLEVPPTADCVPGCLRSIFPCVVLRTSALTATARNVFSARVDGMFPSQIAVSPTPTSSAGNLSTNSRFSLPS